MFLEDEKRSTLQGLLDQYRKTSWKMNVKIFNLSKEDDLLEYQDILTKSCNHDPNAKEGFRIFEEEGRFFEDGSYKKMVRWGEFHVK